MKLSNIKVAEFIKVVLAAKPGRGKTASGFTFPTPMKVFNFDGNNKIEGPTHYIKKFNLKLDDIDVISPEDWNYDWVKFDQMLQMYAKNPSPYKSFGFDSLTSIADSLLGFTAAAKLKADPNKLKKTGGVQVAGIDEYNAETSGIMDIVMFMKDVNAHVWLTAHIIETVRRDIEKNQEIRETSLLSGGKKAAARIPAYFPECYKIEKEEGVTSSEPIRFYVETKSSGDDYARTNFALPKRFEITGKDFFTELNNLIKLNSQSSPTV